MPIFLFLLLGLTVNIYYPVKTSEVNNSYVFPSDSPGFGARASWGEKCELNCDSFGNLECRNSTCVCKKSHPVFSKTHEKCVAAKFLGEDCDENIECAYHDEFAVCRVYTEKYRECDCIEDYEIRNIHGLKIPRICYPGPAITEKDIPTFLGFGLGLSLMSGLICMALRMYGRARFVRPRRYANAAIPPPLTVSETYAAFALANNSRGDSEYRPIGIRSTSSSRRQSSSSQRTGKLVKVGSSSSLVHKKPASRRPSAGSVRSFRSQSGLVLPDLHPEPDHYILYMIRGPSNSLASDSTTMTTCESSSPKTPKSAEQILAVYHPMQEYSDGRERGAVGPSHTTSSFRTISSEDVFQEEDEQDVSSDETSEDNKMQTSNRI